MDITFDSIYSKCQDLSSYEAGKGLADATLYTLIHITDRDKPFIKGYVEEAAANMGAILRFAIDGYTVTDGSVSLNVVSDSTLNAPSKVNLMTEVIATYVMSLWLSNKLTDRSQAYMSMYTELINSLTKSTTRKRPKLDTNY